MGAAAKKASPYLTELSDHGIEIYRHESNNRARIKCHKCGGSHDTAMNVDLPPALFANRFRNAGWHDRGRKWTCPTCQTPRLRDALTSERNKDKPIPPPAFITHLPARPVIVSEIIDRAAALSHSSDDHEDAMTIDEAAPVPSRATLGTRDVLRVLGKLNQYFAAGRYRPGWSDHRISDELGIDLALVAEVREESPDHGPVLVDAEIEALRSEVSSLKEMLEDVIARVEMAAHRVAHSA